MNRKKALVSFVIAAMLLCGSLVLSPVWATTPSDWSKPRPSTGITYNETIGNSKTNGIASVGMGITIGQYSENDPAYGCDHLSLRVSASANTRMGIQYEVLENDYIYDWCEVSEPTGITGDNDGTWLYPDFYFLYYGVEYYRVWVCSNGFIALNKTSTNANPQSIPSTNEPNPVIAVFWRDLHFGDGSSITYGHDIEFNREYFFVVSWNNVLDDSGTPQTFQVLIQHRQPLGSDYHNKIFFQYKSVTQSYPTTVGTEDQVGNKGTAYDYNDLHNEACLKFDYIILGYRLDQLWIKLTKSDDYAAIQMLDTRTAGYNVKLKDYSNPWWADYFKFAIKTTATVLLWKARIAWKCMMIVADFAGVLADDLSPLKPEYTKSALEGEDEAWAWGDCIVENRNCRPFDSTLATTVEWLFIDANDENHDLTVTAEAWYRDLTNDTMYRINTSSTLNMYIARQLSISSTSGGTTNPTPGTYNYSYGTPVTVTASAYSGHRFAAWKLDGVNVGNDNPITVTMDSNHTLKAYFSVSGGGGGDQCPTLFVWNGIDYVDYGVIGIHNPSGEDVIREMPVLAEDVGISNHKAVFRLREGWEGLEFSESVIDQVKLYSIDDEGKRYLCPLISAEHSTLGKVLPQLLASDDNRIQTHVLETIDLTFTMPYQNTQGFIFIIEGCNILKP